MFGFGWSEIAVIGLVALVCIGPKDMPVAMKAIAGVVKKMRRMAGEFQGHVDEMMRDANLQEVHDTFREIRGLSPRHVMDRYVDPDGSVRGAFADPFAAHPVPPVQEAHVPARPEPPVLSAPAPDFLPPGAAARARPAAAASAAAAPDFLPPSHAAAARDHAQAASGPHVEDI